NGSPGERSTPAATCGRGTATPTATWAGTAHRPPASTVTARAVIVARVTTTASAGTSPSSGTACGWASGSSGRRRASASTADAGRPPPTPRGRPHHAVEPVPGVAEPRHDVLLLVEPFVDGGDDDLHVHAVTDRVLERLHPL